MDISCARLGCAWNGHSEYVFPNTLTANAEENWPYDDHGFDVIVMGEVYGRFLDKKALQEAGRVVKPNGTLIVIVPFYDSNNDFHVKLHDKSTITYLIKFPGFSVVATVERLEIVF